SVSLISLMVSGQSATFRPCAHSPCGVSSSWRRASLILSKIGAYWRFSPAGLSAEIGFSRSLGRGMGFGDLIGRGDLQTPDLQDPDILAVHQQRLHPERHGAAVFCFLPHRRAPQPHGVVRMVGTEW